MRTATIRAAIIGATLTAIASAQVFLPGHYLNNADVTFEHQAGPAGLVAVYVNGELIADNMFPGQTSFFSRPMAVGNHDVAIAKAGMDAKSGLIHRENVEVERPGRFALVFREDTVFDPDEENYAYQIDLDEIVE